MDSQQLKQAIADDVKIIKTLNPDIIPARFYYGNLFKVIFSGIWRMSIILLLTLFYVATTDDKDPMIWSKALVDSGITAVFLSTVAMLILLSPISSFVQFQFHLKEKLKTGELIKKKCNQFSMIFFGIFAFFCILFGSYASGQQIFLLLVFSFFLSLGATNIVVSMELSRIGFSSLFTLADEFFSKGKSTSIKKSNLD